MTFGAQKLPPGLHVDPQTGRITGSVAKAGTYHALLTARNARGKNSKALQIIAGDKIALTPPMGWNSWNSWAWTVDQDKVLRSARALVKSGLTQHGWTYINIDDTWQGKPDPTTHALQPNEKFPDMKEPVHHAARHGPEGRHLFHALDWLLCDGTRRQREHARPRLEPAPAGQALVEP